VVAVSLVTFLSLPATADEPKPEPAGDSGKVEDPLEDINRITSGFNSIVRGAVLNPLILLINSVWRIRLETSYPLSRTMHS